MIPCQKKRLSFYENAQKAIIKQNPWIKFINVIFAIIIFILFTAYDFEAIGVLNEQDDNAIGTNQRLRYNNNHGLEILGWCCWSIYLHVLCFYIIRFVMSPPWKNTENFYYIKLGKWRTLLKFLIIDIILSCLNIPLSYPYLKEQITSCDIESLNSSEYQWCTLLILCEQAYRILKLWVSYQYQYIKGLYLKNHKGMKQKSEIEIEESKGLISKDEANGIEIVTTQ
ncbi:8870_t:CDS:2 [Cetraspora pellucida]|uniref:8870_t:CDS:1 n=1 Tax=Cetraspora pellucida TaxID=1433469 RepID=A0A9N9AAX6_9GLOM|nr:8870_t:CDS:2 [Cetraspora pellucida]